MESRKISIVKRLQGIERYNPEHIKSIEEYVELQAQDVGCYDLDANLTLLKLYQLNPTAFNFEIVFKILLKAISNLPNTDIVLCKCLIDLVYHQDDNIRKILKLHDDLEVGNFVVFWSDLASYTDIIRLVSGFEDSVRNFICKTVAITYQTIDKDVLLGFLGLHEVDLQSVLETHKWKDLGSMICITVHDEHIKTKNITEDIHFETVSSIMKSR